MTPLLQLWLDQFGDRDRIELTDEMLPRLLELAPADFSVYVEQGSAAIREGESDIRIELSALLQPAVFAAFESLGLTQTGPLRRTIVTQTSHARHHNFRLPLAWTNQLRGRETLRRSVELYQALGIGEVSLLAVDDGRYVWAMCGFDFATDQDRQTTFRACLDFADRLDLDLDFQDVVHPWEIGAIEGEVTLEEIAVAIGAEPIKLPYPADDKLKTPMRIGKALLLFSDLQGWQGVFDTDPAGICYQQLLRYTGETDGS